MASVFGLSVLWLTALSALGAPSPFVIEAEDFNHGGGQHQSVADTMPYLGGAYNGLGAVAEVDFHQQNNEPSSDEYRQNENPNVPMTQNPDPERPGWTVSVNYRIGWTDAGDWYNYTRNFPAGTYKVSVALSHSSTDPSALKGSLQRVTSAASGSNQAVQQLGVFDAPGSGGWGLNNLVPLKDATGKKVELALSGLTTLRFTAESGDIDYFLFEPLQPPTIAQQPASLTVNENEAASFSVVLAGEDTASFQWQSNQVNIAGATNSTYRLPFTPISADGARFRCVVSNSQGSVTSAEAVLSVSSEMEPPTIEFAYNVGVTTVFVRFSEPVTAASANASGNYRLNGGAMVSNASLGTDGRTVQLTTSALTIGTAYTLTISGVKDASAAGNLILPNSTIDFTAQDYIAQDIGGSGRTLAVGNGYDVTATGADIGANSDAFHFGYQQKTGNFDMRVRIAGISITDAFMQAGLMARESLSADSRFAGAFASSPQIGAFFETRSNAGLKGVNAAPNGGFPANYPFMWLRLQRSGNQFTGFASLDGENWVRLGTLGLTLPSTVYFGLAVSSGTTNTMTKVEFRDLGDATGGVVSSANYGREKLGPSSRRTGLAISEIMYHPAPRADGKQIEFVEIYNGGPIFEDLSGMRISGAVDFVFPAGTRIEAGAFKVVARVPADLESVYGLTGVLGPYNGKLQNDSGTVRLSDERGHVLLEAEYSGQRGWPAAADGAGASLVLVRPSHGEGDVRAWEASTFIGGSPGSTDPVVPIPEQNVVINEFLAHTDEPAVDFIELYNHSNQEVDLSGCWLSDQAGTNRFRIPDNTRIAPRGFVSFDQTRLGFALSAEGEAIFLVSSNRTRVLDAIKFGAQENGVSMGRWPDGAASFRRLSLVTRDGPNSSWRGSDVVINEVMYAPISGESDDEYVELYNNGSKPISLSNWRLAGGIDFKFPSSASIPAGGYVVVGKNAARLKANYSQLNEANTFGNFSGSLKNSGERLALAMPDQVLSTNAFEEVITNKIYIEVSEVAYVDGGRWPAWADGGGSSLELIDPKADTTQPDNWQASDETAKAPWTTVETTGVLDLGHTAYLPVNQLQITLQGAGECLVDAVEVLKGGINYVAVNSDFESGTTGWVFQGNHRETTVEAGDAFQGSRALHIRAPGRGDTGINRIRTALTVNSSAGRVLNANDLVTIRAKVRWLKGWPEVLLRLRGNWLECPGAMTLPVNLGSPGQPNSRRINNAGPAIYEISHSPALPAAGENALVTCRVSDPNGIGSLMLRYRLDPSATLLTAPMRDDGTQGDAVANDGLFTGILPARSAGNLVAFRIEAADAAGATTVFPSGAPARECLIRWGEQVRFGTLATYFMWATSATATEWGNSDDKDNTYHDVTFVYNADRVVYNADVKDKGSPFHGGGGDAYMVLPKDDKVLGATDFALCSTGNSGNEPTSQREQLIFWIARKMGSNYLNRRSVNFIYNGSSFRGRNIMEDAEEPNGQYAQSSVPASNGGDLYKIEDWFEFDDSTGSFNNTDATLEVKTTTGGVYKLARYRWMWRKRAVEDSSNNYTNLFNLVSAANNVGGGDYIDRLESLVNMREWMAVFAMQRIAGNWDSYGFSRGKNAYIYKGDGVRWEMFPWDIDFVLGAGSNGPSDPLWGGNEPVVNRMFNTLQFRRYLWQAYLQAVTGPLLPEQYQAQTEAKYRVFLANNISGVSSPASITTYIDARRAKILSDMNSVNTSSFAITSNNGNDVTTSNPVLTLTGRAPLAVYSIEINGMPYPVRWTSVTDWSIPIPLSAARTTLTVTGHDQEGNLLPQMSDSVTVTYTGTLYRPEDFVVINEIMYHPAEPGASFIELFNRNSSVSFDLSGFRLDGIGYTFPSGSVISPNSYRVLVQNLAGFSAAYGPNPAVLGEYPGSLDNGGERIALVRPGATSAEDTIIDEVRYDDDPPWPVLGDGQGPSLQLIDAAQDNWPAANWGVTAANAANRATPGAANSVLGLLAPFPRVYINEVLPENLGSDADRFGEKEPWIELMNRGTTTVDLSGYYLSDDLTNLAKWPFPAGSSLAAGEFLIVWADGEASEGNATERHTNFRLNRIRGGVALSRQQGTQPAAVDYLNYDIATAGRSYGSYPDGQPQRRRLFHYPTFRAPNNPASIPVSVFINEWMAGNTRIADPADGDFDDWFELYNAGGEPVDLSGYTLTDSLTNATKYTIPNGNVIPPGGHLVVWADEETGQNSNGADVHANFKLALAGEEIGLFAPDGSVVDSVEFGAQVEDRSEGRASDGEAPPFVVFATPSPGAANVLSSGNQPPVLVSIGDQTVVEGSLLTFQAEAGDPDAGQTLVFSLSGAPEGAAIDPITGVFTWKPSEIQGPANYSIALRVVDNGMPPRSAVRNVNVSVSELNLAPEIEDLSEVTVDEGSPMTAQIVARDPDLPANTLTYTLDRGAPRGMAINEATGEIMWVPAEDQGPGDYAVVVLVRDDGVPPLTASATLRVHVREANNEPILDPILPVTIDEGDLLEIAAHAEDPDFPPAAIIYSLEPPVPSGAAIDPVTGVLTWRTTETDGPSTNFFTVRATEKDDLKLSASRNFTVIVREVNQAPVLGAIPDQTMADGEELVLAVQGRDNDVPAQALAYSLSGAPGGMSIDPKSGVIRWIVALDHPSSTNRVTVTVTDSGPNPLSASKSFSVIVRPAVRVVINEIMHTPEARDGEYIELLNLSGATTWDLTGWRLAGAQLEFTFGPDSMLPPGGFLVVARNRAVFEAEYGARIPVAGEWVGRLRPERDTLQLLRPENKGESLVDIVTFENGLPWPNATGGAALQLIDPRVDNDRVANWVATAEYGGSASPLTFTSVWRYEQSGKDLGAAWRERSFDDGAWPSGPGLLYVETADLPAPKSTPLTRGPTTFYFRTRFNLPVKPSGAQLTLNTVIDDGAIFYLNGTEVFRLGMPAGPVNSSTFANRTVSDAVMEGPFTIPSDALVAGENLLAVEVHQINATSSDIVFGCALNIEGGQVASRTPGLANSVVADLAAFEPVYLNELLSVNESGIVDSAGEREPWIELHNAGAAAVSLEGMFLSDDHGMLTRWPFPAGATLAPGEFKIVWLDGEPGETLGPEWHTAFRASAARSVMLSRLQNGLPAVIDYLNLGGTAVGESVGSLPDGQLDFRAGLLPTPGGPNQEPIQMISMAARLSTEGCVLVWLTQPGVRYRVEMQETLGSGDWRTLMEMTATSGASTFTDPIAAARRFYRVQALP